jgi:hypothetical protein
MRCGTSGSFPRVDAVSVVSIVVLYPTDQTVSRATMRYADLVQLYFDRSNALQSYWTLYVVVIGGLLAFSSLRKDRNFLVAGLVTVLYVCFAYKNLGAIGDATVQRLAILDAIKQFSTQPAGSPDEAEVDRLRTVRGLLEPTLTPPDFAGTRTFHVATDVLTAAALWTLVLSRRKPAGEANAPA